MNGQKSKMATGVKPIKIGEKEYDAGLHIEDTANYIKKLQELALKLQFYGSEKDIDNVTKISDEIVDFKIKFVEDALILGGMPKDDAKVIIGSNVKDVIHDGNIEVWLGFTSKKEMDEAQKLKN